jgi:hypothetical protein
MKTLKQITNILASGKVLSVVNGITNESLNARFNKESNSYELREGGLNETMKLAESSLLSAIQNSGRKFKLSPFGQETLKIYATFEGTATEFLNQKGISEKDFRAVSKGFLRNLFDSGILKGEAKDQKLEDIFELIQKFASYRLTLGLVGKRLTAEQKAKKVADNVQRNADHAKAFAKALKATSGK